MTVTATDGDGNATTKTFTVTVRDTTRAGDRTVPASITLEATGPAGAVVTYAAATATRRGRPGHDHLLAARPARPSRVGTTTVTITATDGAGNTLDADVHGHRARHDGAGDLTWSPNLTVEATSAAGAAVTYRGGDGDRRRRRRVTFTYSQSSGATFALGTTTVTVTATDAAGNHSSKTFTVTVRDTTAPVLTPCRRSPSRRRARRARSSRYPPASSPTPSASTSVTYSKASGSTFARGSTVVDVHREGRSRQHDDRHFTVVVQDTTAPTITSISANLTIEATSAGRCDRQLRGGDRDRRRRPRDDHLLEGVRHGVRARHDDRHGHREGRRRQHHDAHLHDHRPRHDAAGRSPPSRRTSPSRGRARPARSSPSPRRRCHRRRRPGDDHVLEGVRVALRVGTTTVTVTATDGAGQRRPATSPSKSRSRAAR